jgi:N-glycosylase/DNA lyase
MYTVKEHYTENGTPYVHAENIPRLNIFKTFDCGQCFRFEPVSLFGNRYEFGGVAYGKYVVFAQNSDTEILVYGSTKEEFLSLWAKYLALDVDYEEIDKTISSALKSEHMDKCIEYSRGIRILRQDRWEALCSFIISQNNNIPRIKKIISAMSKKYGEVSHFGDVEYYSFPTEKSLIGAGIDGLFELKTGFRAKYIYDACDAVINGRVSIDRLIKEKDFNKCLEEICQIKGVGLKVASCALLFGFEKTEAFPIDVWMKRALEKYFPKGIDLIALGKTAGIAQQYLFYYEKYVQNS